MRDAAIAGHFDSKAASRDADDSKHELAADIGRGEMEILLILNRPPRDTTDA